MVEIGIGTNEQGQRLDRFLRKFLPGMPLSMVYRVIRKDVKVCGRRRGRDYMLADGDVIQLYLDQSLVDGFRGRSHGATSSDGSGGEHLAGHGSGEHEVRAASKGSGRSMLARRPRKTFKIAYEDNEILIADKPAGLLTHGDRAEKSKHLTNQVLDYLIEKGEYSPRNEKTFSPAPVNRIDRNTSGLVIFAKNYDALKKFNEYIRTREKIRKIYLTVVCGRIASDMTLSGMIEKDEDRNISGMRKSPESKKGHGQSRGGKGFDNRAAGGDGLEEDEVKARTAVTYVRPLRSGTIKGMGDDEFTLAEVEIETGRTHQIRVQLSDAGYPLAGDPKYGDPVMNRKLHERFGLTHQLLTAARLEFRDMDEYPELSGKTVEARFPKVFDEVIKSMSGGGYQVRSR